MLSPYSEEARYSASKTRVNALVAVSKSPDLIGAGSRAPDLPARAAIGRAINVLAFIQLPGYGCALIGPRSNRAARKGRLACLNNRPILPMPSCAGG